MLALRAGERAKKRILQSLHDSWKRLHDAKLCSVRSSMQQENNQRATDMDMQESSDMNKQTLFNDTLEELIDACADYREAEQPDSGQGSWGRAMLYNQVLVQVRRVSDLVVGGALETDGGVAADDPRGCACAQGPSVIALAYPTTCLSCGGVVSE